MTTSDEINSIVSMIRDNYNPQKIILFGSNASGTAKKNSDIDLFIVKNDTKKRAFRSRDVFKSVRGLNRSRPLDVIVYTPKELSERLKLGDYFVNEVMNKGRVLYAS